MTRRCSDGGRLRVALVGDIGAVRDVNFKLGRRLAVRDRRTPFAGTIGARARRRTGAVAYLRDGDPFRIILSRTLPDGSR